MRQSAFLPREVFIAGAARTPIGAFCGALSTLPAPRLGAAAIVAALQRARIQPEEVEGVVFGHALPGGCGQHAARQAAILAEIPEGVDCTGVNKACASGLKAVAFAAQAIALGHAEIVVAGGMESMSQSPYMLKQARTGGYHYGHGVLEDSVLHDGLSDALSRRHLGSCVEKTVREMVIPRLEQDNFAIESYRRAADAWQRGAMDQEVAVIPVRSLPSSDPLGPKTVKVATDEEYSRLTIGSVGALRPVFEEEGTVTAASASSLNDGAAAVVLVSAERARELGIGVLARVVAFADHAVVPADFAVAPNGAVRRALRAARMSGVDFHEINETFAAVALANMRLLEIDASRVNVNGGAVALGHPLGASGARILCTLLSVLEQRDAETGCASIAGGGGSASAMVVERAL